VPVADAAKLSCSELVAETIATPVAVAT
jgi:hypothetical protein